MNRMLSYAIAFSAGLCADALAQRWWDKPTHSPLEAQARENIEGLRRIVIGPTRTGKSYLFSHLAEEGWRLPIC